jgi:hypothetical protein
MQVYGTSLETGYCPNVTVASNSCTPGSGTLSISATPARVRSGETVALAWSATGAGGTCSVTGPGINWSSGALAVPQCSASGSGNPSIVAQSTYVLDCGGQKQSVTVNVIPSFEEF